MNEWQESEVKRLMKSLTATMNVNDADCPDQWLVQSFSLVVIVDIVDNMNIAQSFPNHCISRISSSFKSVIHEAES